MKKNYFLITLLLLSAAPIFGKIKNGYERDLLSAKESLRVLTSLFMTRQDLEVAKKHRIKSEIENLTSYILYYRLTEQLLEQLRDVSPTIFDEIDNIRDKRGRPTDVIVKFIPKDRARVPLRAASFFAQSPIDKDACHSTYGEYTVAIDISLCEKSLLLLCHEFGHVSYIIPNMDSFRTFYSKNYSKTDIEQQPLGHCFQDPSGRGSKVFEKRFCKDNSARLRQGAKKLESPFLIVRRIKKSSQHWNTDDSKAIASVITQW